MVFYIFKLRQSWASTCFGRGWSEFCSVQKVTHNIQDLLQGQTELERDRLTLLQHRPLQLLVMGHQVIEQPSLVRASFTSYYSDNCHDLVFTAAVYRKFYRKFAQSLQ